MFHHLISCNILQLNVINKPSFDISTLLSEIVQFNSFGTSPWYRWGPCQSVALVLLPRPSRGFQSTAAWISLNHFETTPKSEKTKIIKIKIGCTLLT